MQRRAAYTRFIKEENRSCGPISIKNNCTLIVIANLFYLAKYFHFDQSVLVHDDLQGKAVCDASFAPQRM